MTQITIDTVSKTYPNGTKALKEVSCTISPGEAVILLGHNGSGKSTLFKCLGGFEPITGGTIHIGDTEISHLSFSQRRPFRKKMGTIFQHFHLIPTLSVLQNVLFGTLGETSFVFPALAPFASQETREKALHCLERVNLAEYAGTRSDELSGGQKQRVAIARMLMQDPEIVLADEPIASLDPRAGHEVMELLWEIVSERNLTLICVLHQIEIAKQFGDRVIALKHGSIISDTRVNTLDEDFLSFLYRTEAVHMTKDERVFNHGKECQYA
ncbi:phosphonate ABC transporter ATP-binding protein [Chitinivibrio alkaliphilus]|uniref:Phosphonate ABC transporter, ATPase subunit n=1 Tax=Chitinivibrio alkaliphilus ACht1 TaxID=1313304 RepID=U7D317_9BACT|nr:phosphonate ABC transporter ATP-binding protein [Chitinivibrio alkaliphilus]ERP30884.1 phosphonate ABC transporter, ATPase subunit [Chitinivibrio alkaliphilus ACht1]